MSLSGRLFVLGGLDFCPNFFLTLALCKEIIWPRDIRKLKYVGTCSLSIFGRVFESLAQSTISISEANGNFQKFF